MINVLHWQVNFSKNLVYISLLHHRMFKPLAASLKSRYRPKTCWIRWKVVSLDYTSVVLRATHLNFQAGSVIYVVEDLAPKPPKEVAVGGQGHRLRTRRQQDAISCMSLYKTCVVYWGLMTLQLIQLIRNFYVYIFICIRLLHSAGRMSPVTDHWPN